MQGLRSDPPPNHHVDGVQNIRVFMWTAGAWGLRMCATTLTPLAQKRGSASTPGTPRADIAARASAPSSPCTSETLTPAFSNTRPARITLHRPPPAPPPARRIGLSSNRPGVASQCGPLECPASTASKAATTLSRSSRNQSAARAFSAFMSEDSVMVRPVPGGAGLRPVPRIRAPRRPACGSRARASSAAGAPPRSTDPAGTSRISPQPRPAR